MTQLEIIFNSCPEGKIFRVNCPGAKNLGGNCPGGDSWGNVRGVVVQGIIVWENVMGRLSGGQLHRGHCH